MGGYAQVIREENEGVNFLLLDTVERYLKLLVHKKKIP